MESVEEKIEKLQDDTQTIKDWIKKADKMLEMLTYAIYEMKTQAEKDRQASEERMKKYEEKAEKDRQALYERMRKYEEEAERDRQASEERMKRYEETAERDRQEWRRLIDEMKTQAEKDRQASEERMKRYEEKAEKDRQASEERMRRYEEAAERDRQALYERMRKYEEEAERDRQASEERMKRYEEAAERDRQEWRRLIDEMKTQAEKDRRDWNKKWGKLANKTGTIVEDIVFPASRPVIESYFKCEITDLMLRRRKKIKSQDMKVLAGEFDVIAVSEPCKSVYLIEVKSLASKQYVDDFINDVIPRFKSLFKEYEDYKLIPILASLRIEEDVLNYLTSKGIYGMAYREWDYMDILNFEDIKRD